MSVPLRGESETTGLVTADAEKSGFLGNWSFRPDLAGYNGYSEYTNCPFGVFTEG
jgi:hypothetical protein